jgi:valyl-tRNA synthetase
MIEKNYQPADIENRMAKAWESAGAFKAGRPERKDAAPFTIVIPPPNVTGSLHMGHALNNTLQDILCRFERMRGRDVLWQPGTDHAGIATQMVVERQLMERQEPGRRDMGRAKFLERSGPGRPRAAAPSSTSSSGSARPATGRANASPWTRACRAPSPRCSSNFIATG